MPGLTLTGFDYKRLPQLKAELEADLVDALGELNLNPETVVGQLVGIESEARAEFWQLMDDVYQSQYPSSADGVNLDRVVTLNGLTRKPALPTTVTGILTGGQGALIPAGALARNSQTADQYTLLDNVVIDATTASGGQIVVFAVADSTIYGIDIGPDAVSINSGIGATESTILDQLVNALNASGLAGVSATLGADRLTLIHPEAVLFVTSNLFITRVDVAAQFAATLTGPKLLPAGALDTIVTPIALWTAVTNRTAGLIGRLVEKDSDLRIRRIQSTRLGGNNLLDAIAADILLLDGVTAANIRHNNTDVTDGDGVPPQHLWAIVQGGTGAAIALVLYGRGADGIGFFGGQTEIVISPVTGDPHEVKYERPTIIGLFMSISITASSSIPTDYINLVRIAMVAYIDALAIGESVLYSRLFAPANNALDEDSTVTTLLVSTVDPPIVAVTIPIAQNEKAQVLPSDIEVLLL